MLCAGRAPSAVGMMEKSPGFAVRIALWLASCLISSDLFLLDSVSLYACIGANNIYPFIHLTTKVPSEVAWCCSGWSKASGWVERAEQELSPAFATDWISLNRAQDVRWTIILGNPKKKKMLPSSDTMISYLLELYSYLKSSLRLTWWHRFLLRITLYMYKNGKCKQNKLVKVVKALTKDHQKHTCSQKVRFI